MKYASTLLLIWSLSSAFVLAAPVEREVLDGIFRPAIEQGKVRSMVVGVVDASGRVVAGYAPADAPAVDGRTVYEIGSITKGFTGLLLAQMVQAGEVALEDPVAKYLPASVRIQAFDDQPITLLHLATHRSGLPRMPGNFFPPKDPSNPYAHYTVERMYEHLRSSRPTAAPGTSHAYSNLGSGLLGHVLGLRAGKSYEDLILERICRPLGMEETRITLTDSMRQRLASGHTASGKPAANWDIPTFAGAGALRSTVDDMLTFLEAQLGLRQTPLAEAIALSHKRHAEIGDGGGMALGWHIGRGGAIWHNGETGGYHSFTAFDPRKGIGVVILSNTATGLIDDLGTQCVRRILESAPTRPAE